MDSYVWDIGGLGSLWTAGALKVALMDGSLVLQKIPTDQR